MMLVTKALRAQLVKNFEINSAAIDLDGNTTDFPPVVKIFNPYGNQTWLLSELDPETGRMFGLCDLGQGFPELGYVMLDELERTRIGMFGWKLERDRHFEGDKPVSKYS